MEKQLFVMPHRTIALLLVAAVLIACGSRYVASAVMM
jgi:hypothetical protein